jgi:hypothetical protein
MENTKRPDQRDKKNEALPRSEPGILVRTGRLGWT